jgi:hypothetical protein
MLVDERAARLAPVPRRLKAGGVGEKALQSDN